MDSEDYICPNCLSEFSEWVDACTKCGTRVLPRETVEAIVERTRRASAKLPPAAELEPLREAPLSWAKSLSQRLSVSGVPHRIEDISGAPRLKSAFGMLEDRMFAIYIDPADAEVAHRLDRAHLAAELPDADDSGDPSKTACPACGEQLTAGADQCPACGLHFPE